MKILTPTKNLSHEQWLEFRRQGLGGSDAPTIIGFNPYSSLFRLYADKKGLVEPVVDNEAMRQGRDLEAYVAQRFTEETGKKVRRRNYMFQSEEYPFMLADIDREVVGENAGLECKTTSAFAKSDFEGGEIPLYYYAQMTHYMAVMDYDKMYLAVLVLGRGFYWFCIERDEDEINALISVERDFWEQHIVADQPPEIDGSDATIKTLKEMYPSNNDNDDELAIISESLMTEYESVKTIYDESKKRFDGIKAKIIEKMGSIGNACSKDYKITYKVQTKTSIDAKSLKKDCPEIYAKYLNVSQSRVLRVAKKKEEK